MLMLSVGL